MSETTQTLDQRIKEFFEKLYLDTGIMVDEIKIEWGRSAMSSENIHKPISIKMSGGCSAWR